MAIFFTWIMRREYLKIQKIKMRSTFFLIRSNRDIDANLMILSYNIHPYDIHLSQQ